jgi:hypothetical protein
MPWHATLCCAVMCRACVQSFQGEDGLKLVVSHLKQQYGLQYIYAWHAMMGFWGGVAPGIQQTAKYQPRLVFPKPTRSLLVGGSLAALEGGRLPLYLAQLGACRRCLCSLCRAMALALT